MTAGWTPADIPSQAGRTAVVTGATSGLGLATARAAATADLPGGSYAGPDRMFELRGRPTLVGRTAAASDPELARALWTASAELTGTDFPAPLPV